MGSSVHGDFPGKNTIFLPGGLPYPPPGDLPNPGIDPRCLTLQKDSLLSEPPDKPKNTGVGCLSLLRGIFLTQELNWGLLPCRWILYQLSYQGSPGRQGQYRVNHFILSFQKRNKTGISLEVQWLRLSSCCRRHGFHSSIPGQGGII